MNETETQTPEAPAPEVRSTAPSKPKLYRCYGCRNSTGALGVDFKSAEALDEVACPKCGIKKSCPRVGHYIERLVVMHFEPPYPHPELGKTTGIGHLACDPAKPTGNGRYRYTAERSIVNCPACQASAAFINGEAGQFDPAFDLPLTKDGILLPDEPVKGGE